MNSMSWEDHRALAEKLKQSPIRWVLTYDKDPRVKELYPDHPCAVFGVSHTAADQHIGKEYLVSARNLHVPDLKGFGPRRGRWLPNRSPGAVLAEGG